MFEKRKSIVIGETYLFDILNETNMATTTTLVTVVSKVKKNEYIVRSVNNGDVFTTPAKYLTPYVNPDLAVAVRCQYGTTDITDVDITIVDTLASSLMMFTGFIDSMQKGDIKFNGIDALTKGVTDVVEASKVLTNKLRKYADISRYKDTLSMISNIKKVATNTAFKFNDNGSNPELDEFNDFVDREAFDFKMRFEAKVQEYMGHAISEEEFIDEAVKVIEEHYPIELLMNNTPTSYDRIKSCIINVFKRIEGDNMITIAFGRDDNGKFHSWVFDSDDVKDESIITETDNFIHKLYPMCNLKGVIRPKYIFSAITIDKRRDDYAE